MTANPHNEELRQAAFTAGQATMVTAIMGTWQALEDDLGNVAELAFLDGIAYGVEFVDGQLGSPEAIELPPRELMSIEYRHDITRLLRPHRRSFERFGSELRERLRDNPDGAQAWEEAVAAATTKG